MTVQRISIVALVSSVLSGGCRRDAGVIPETPLGAAAREWLFAHNQGDGHAMVHFTLGNRGSAPMPGALVDSVVRHGVRVAQAIGPLTPVRLVQSSDTVLAIDLRASSGVEWNAQLTPAPEPSMSKVRVHLRAAPCPRTVLADDSDPQLRIECRP